MSLSKAVETAMKMETDAMDFYREASRKSVHPFGKKMFEGFIRDETRHLRMLEDILKGLDINPHTNCTDDVRTVFSELKDQMMNRIEATTDEVEAVRIALDFEEAGYHFYETAAKEASSEKEKNLFEVLTAEEERHYKVLENTYRFLEDTGNWFMWEELSIVEGG
jgi:rubrerythrin